MITTLATSQNLQQKKKKKRTREKKKSDVKYSAFVQRWPATALQKKYWPGFYATGGEEDSEGALVCHLQNM